MLKCPICKKSAVIEESFYYNAEKYAEKYIVKCGCVIKHLRGNNEPDLEANWNKWVRMIKKMRE